MDLITADIRCLVQFSRFRGFVFDVDGVLKVGSRPIGGAPEVLEFLRERGRKVVLLTNIATKSRAQQARHLRGIGIRVSVDEIFTSAYAAARHLRERYGRVTCLAVGEVGLADELRGAGHRVLSGTRGERARFVVVGLDRGFNYGKLAVAQHAILNGARFIATNTDAWYPTERGTMPGAGAMVAAVAAAAKCEPELVVGKPNVALLKLAMEHMGVRKKDVVVIGDSIDTDMEMARRAGVAGALVLTGNATMAAVRRLPKKERPVMVLRSVSDIVERW